MFEFKVLEGLQPNSEFLELIKNYNFTISLGKIRHLINTNLKFIEPTKYEITEPFRLTILEYKVNEISNKSFYVPEKYEKYNLIDLKLILVKLQEN